MNIIGQIAGNVWQELNDNGQQQYKQVKEKVLETFKDTPMKEQRFAMAIGWLAREEKLNFVEQGKGKRYRLFLELK